MVLAWPGAQVQTDGSSHLIVTVPGNDELTGLTASARLNIRPHLAQGYDYDLVTAAAAATTAKPTTGGASVSAAPGHRRDQRCSEGHLVAGCIRSGDVAGHRTARTARGPEHLQRPDRLQHPAVLEDVEPERSRCWGSRNLRFCCGVGFSRRRCVRGCWHVRCDGCVRIGCGGGAAEVSVAAAGQRQEQPRSTRPPPRRPAGRPG